MQEGVNSATRGNKNSYTSSVNQNFIRYGEVLSVDDPLDLGRIKVWVKGSVATGGDDELIGVNIGYDDLPWCHPLLPKHLQIKPKVGEGVYIFVFNKEKENVDRLYIGPVISQLNKLGFDTARTTALAGFSFGPALPQITPTSFPEIDGVFPNSEDVVLQGRYNTDIIQKTNEVVIRAGKFETIPATLNSNPYYIKFNSSTPAFIQLKNDITLPKLSDNQVGDRKGSVTNIVSSKINLITHDGSPNFNIPNQEVMVSDEELERILTTAHQLPYGDVLLQYLRLLKEAFISHVHNGNGRTPTDIGSKRPVATFIKEAQALEEIMLSKNVRIN
jgi:hypothetical protein